ncbi:MAG: biopolymer transporter ExbD, partial [Bacteroidales bacterium]|nr:biopolymer transporter ExbD [Bacteroidales bacterium]
MGRFGIKKQKGTPGISTSSLPDIIFMLLFFFMVATTMRETTPLVKVSPPYAFEVQKLEKKSLVSYIMIGPPSNKKLGTESRIQLNDRLATTDDIQNFIIAERESRDEIDRKFLTTSLKVDKEVK